MKVLLSLSIILAIFGGFVSSQVTTAEFEAQIQDLRASFHGIHREIDYRLRDSRWDISELLQEWNKDLLSHHANLTTDIQNRRYEVYNEILDRVDELGNQNECLISLDGRLTAASVAATEQAKQCAQSSYDFITAAIRDNYYFDLVNRLQRSSTATQHVQFYYMGAYNVITNQQDVLNSIYLTFMEHGWRRSIWTGYIDREEANVQQSNTVGITSSNACIESVFESYSASVNGIRGEIAGCA